MAEAQELKNLIGEVILATAKWDLRTDGDKDERAAVIDRLVRARELATALAAREPKAEDGPAHWLVTWSIDMWARTPLEAAMLAQEIQQDPEAIADTFTVKDDDGLVYEVDIGTKECLRLNGPGTPCDVVDGCPNPSIDCIGGEVWYCVQHQDEAYDAWQAWRASPERRMRKAAIHAVSPSSMPEPPALHFSADALRQHFQDDLEIEPLLDSLTDEQVEEAARSWLDAGNPEPWDDYHVWACQIVRETASTVTATDA